LGTIFTPKLWLKFRNGERIEYRRQLQHQEGIYNYYNKSDTIASLAAGEGLGHFPDTFMNAMDVYSAIFRTTLTGDQFAGNNRDTTELRPYQLLEFLPT
jgi:hypothetical protein